MSNEKAGCGRIPLVSELRLKIAALSSDPGNSFRGFWHCAEILTFSLLPSRAGGEESMCRDNKRAQLCLRLVGHTPGIVHLKFSKINQYSYQLWLLHLVGWHWELRCTHHTSISKSVSGLLKTVPNHRQVWKRWMSNWFAFQTSPKLDSFHCVTAPLKGNCAPASSFLASSQIPQSRAHRRADGHT